MRNSLLLAASLLFACTTERERPVSSEGAGPGPSGGPTGSGGDGAMGGSGAAGSGASGGSGATGGSGGATTTGGAGGTGAAGGSGGAGGAGGGSCPGGKLIVIQTVNGPETVCTTGEVGEFCLVGGDCDSASCDLFDNLTYGTCE